MRGQILIQSLVLSGLAVVFITVLVNLALYNVNTANLEFYSEQAFQIAEAGIEYYRWHLAHNPADYTNGTGQPGPYTIAYADKSGAAIGEYVLTITPPPAGGTLVVIRSTGKVYAEPKALRTIEAKLAIPSFATYAILANDDIRFGVGTTVSGPVHSNKGIRFDGTANNIVTSSLPDYNDPDHSGTVEFGVHTHRDPPPATSTVNNNFIPAEAPPSTLQNRTDVFLAGRQFPVPAVDFTGLMATLSQIKTSAQSGGLYFPDSGAQGYEAVLRPDDTVAVYKVQSLVPKPGGCSNLVSDKDWGIWSIQATTTVGTYPIPANGLVFFEDHVWVSGQVNTARVTIASARFPQNPATETSITVDTDLLYTNYDGQDAIGLMAQNDFNVGLYSKDNLRIDGAIVAADERVGRHYYRAPSGQQQYCGPEAMRNKITLYGMLVTNQRYGFSWTCSGVYCSGYNIRDILYDPNLALNPPPGFPLTSSQYEVISWEEIK